MAKTEDYFKKALESRNIPILTLDNKWHQLFTKAEKTAEITVLENELNELLKRQGKLNNELKSIKKVKKKLMDDIVVSADVLDKTPGNKQEEKKLENNKRLLNECNEKIRENEDELIDLPRNIYQKNQALMLATMKSCYEILQKNTKEISEISLWIAKMRLELKEKIIHKQESEQKNKELYAYMHDIFGPEVIELFDIQIEEEKKEQV